MQLKLLNFHKVLSQFASNIVGAFLALIVYQSTQSFSLAFLFLVINLFARVIISQIFYKKMTEKPQLFLLIRLIPFFLYSLSILLLETKFMIIGLVLAAIFNAIAVSFKELPMELVFNYSAFDKGSSTNGISRLLENGGVILAIITGGLFLDNVPKWIPILTSCSVYLISVIPLFIYYIKQKNNPTFNKDATSNAVESFNEIKIKKHQQTIISKKILIHYNIIYFLFCVYDALLSLFSLYLFKVNAESYGFTSYIQSSFYALFGFGCYVAGKLDEKIDLTKIVSFFSVLSGIFVCIVPFLSKNIIIEIIIFGIIGFLYSFISIFCYSRMMTRCKILGISNIALQRRAQASRLSQLFIFLFASLSSFMFIPTFFIVGITFASCSFAIPINEEKTRTMLVDYLQNNKMF